MKVMTLVGTRPELVKLSETIKRLDEFTDHIFVHSGQNYDYELNGIFYSDLGVRKPDHYLDCAGKNAGETIANVIASSYELFARENPDALLILGDTNSSLSAISAKRHKIPVFHLEAGNRCFDENLPEEINRRIVDHISDVNLPYTEHARRNLLREGMSQEFTFAVGSPLREIIEKHRKKIDASSILQQENLNKGQYILLSAHREENLDNDRNFRAVVRSIHELAERFRMPVLYSVHPRTAKKITESGCKLPFNVRMHKPFGFTDYMKLQENAFCVVSDSGTLAEEAGICCFPAVSLRTSSERPEALEKGGFILGGRKDLAQKVDAAVRMASGKSSHEEIPDYHGNNFSDKIVKIILGYAQVVNRKVWGRENEMD